MGFGDELLRFAAKADRTVTDVFVGSTLAAEESIKVGSPITGAPGQPVDTGNLRNSWQTEFDRPVMPERAAISTTVEYAPAVEDGVGPEGPRTYGQSGVGGSHSVALTAAGWDKIVEHTARRMGDGR